MKVGDVVKLVKIIESGGDGDIQQFKDHIGQVGKIIKIKPNSITYNILVGFDDGFTEHFKEKELVVIKEVRVVEEWQ